MGFTANVVDPFLFECCRDEKWFYVMVYMVDLIPDATCLEEMANFKWEMN